MHDDTIEHLQELLLTRESWTIGEWEQFWMGADLCHGSDYPKGLWDVFELAVPNVTKSDEIIDLVRRNYAVMGGWQSCVMMLTGLQATEMAWDAYCYSRLLLPSVDLDAGSNSLCSLRLGSALDSPEFWQIERCLLQNGMLRCATTGGGDDFVLDVKTGAVHLFWFGELGSQCHDAGRFSVSRAENVGHISNFLSEIFS